MAFDPTTLFPGAAGDREGAIIKIRPENLWQDDAGTVPVTADGDPVRRIDDISVNGRDFIAFDATVEAVYKTNGTVHWISVNGSLDHGYVSADAWTFMAGNPYTVGAAVDFANASAGDQYFFGTTPSSTSGGGSGSGATDSVVHLGARTGSTATIAHWFNDQDFSHSFPDTPERHICEFKNPGSEYTVDGTQIDVSTTTPDVLDQIQLATIMLREPYVSSHEVCGGDLYGMIIVIDTITAQEKLDIDEWLQEQIEGPSETTEGALESQDAAMSGAGTIDTPATGTLTTQAATMSGAGTQTYAATGALAAQAATMAGEALPGIFHVGSEKATSASSATVTVDKPAGAAEDDFALFVASADDGATNTITFPVGVTSIFNGEIPNSEVGSVRIALGYKFLGASEPASYDVTFAAIDANVVSCNVWRNVDATTVPDVAFAYTTRGPALDETLPPAPSVTTLSDNAAIITLVADTRGPSFGDMDFNDYYQPPAGTTEVIDANIGAGTDMAGHAVGWDTQLAAGATGTRQWACIDNNDGGFAGTLALRQIGAPVTEDGVAEGAMAAQAATMSGAGTLESAATGAMAAQAATMSGAGTQTYAATGALTAQAATMAGEATDGAVTGSLEAQPATVSGAGTFSIPATGAVEAASATIAGEGTQTYTGTGSLAAQAATLAGVADFANLEATGALLAQDAAMAGEGTSVDAIPSEGALQAQDATMAGVANLETAAIGELLAGPAFLKASTTGLGDFYWTEAPTTTPGRLPARRNHRPLIFEDRADGQFYILTYYGPTAGLEVFAPRRQDDIYEAYSEPTLDVEGTLVRVFVESGVLRWERYAVDRRNRPILFGSVARTRPREARYRLQLDPSALD